MNTKLHDENVDFLFDAFLCLDIPILFGYDVKNHL